MVPVNRDLIFKLREELAFARGWTVREGWSIEDASECACYFNGDTQTTPVHLFFPENAYHILRALKENNASLLYLPDGSIRVGSETVFGTGQSIEEAFLRYQIEFYKRKQA